MNALIKQVKPIEKMPEYLLMEILESVNSFDIEALLEASKTLQKRFLQNKELKLFYQAKQKQELVNLQEWLRLFGKLYTLEELRNLEMFNLVYWLFSLPYSIGLLTNLKRLNLYSNGLTSLPDSIGSLTNLETLDLHGNKLTSLPDSIGLLVNLERLYLLGNQLTSLPDSIGHLTNLKELWLSRNKLTSLPDSIGRLVNLKLLDLRENRLTRLPDSIGRLVNLKRLI